MIALCLTALLSAMPQPRPATSTPTASSMLSDDAVRTQVTAYVNSIDTPVRASQWRSLGDRGAAALAELAQDPSALPSRRARAVTGMAVIGGDLARATADRLAHATEEPLTVRVHAVRALALVAPPAELLTRLSPLLESDANPRVRAAVAEVLAVQAPDEGCVAVTAQLKKEAADVRPQFDRAAAHCKAE